MGQFKGEGERSEGYGGKWWKSAAAVAAAAGYHTVSGAADDTNTTAAKYNKDTATTATTTTTTRGQQSWGQHNKQHIIWGQIVEQYYHGKKRKTRRFSRPTITIFPRGISQPDFWWRGKESTAKEGGRKQRTTIWARAKSKTSKRSYVA